jgi:plastocyanin
MMLTHPSTPAPAGSPVHAGPSFATPLAPADRRRLAAGGALACLAGVVHYAAAYDHLAEGPAPAAFLALVGTAQLGAGMALARRPGPRLVAGVVAGSLALFALFSVAYSVGLPFGPHAGEPEHFGPIVAVSKLTELVLLWLIAPYLSMEGAAGWGPIMRGRPAAVGRTVGLVPTALAALAGVLLLAGLALALGAAPAHAAALHQMIPGAVPAGAVTGAPSVLPAGAPGGPTAAAEIRLFEYRPPRMEVARGTALTWVNLDLIEHSVTSGTGDAPDRGRLYDSGLLAQGAAFTLRFDAPGEYAYFCTKHPSMRGVVSVVEVLPAPPAPAAPPAPPAAPVAPSEAESLPVGVESATDMVLVGEVVGLSDGE